MSASSHRFLVTTYDYDLWQVVVEAANQDEALSKAARIYLADGFGANDTVAYHHGDLKFAAVPVVAEVRK